MISCTIKFHSKKFQNTFNCKNFVTAHAFLTRWHLFTFFTVAPFLYTPSVILDFCFILVASNTNLGEFVWRTQFQTGSRGFYFPCCSILQGNCPNFGMEILALRSAKSFRDSVVGFIFFLILFSYSTQLFKNQLKHTQDAYILCVLFYFQVACNCSNSLKQEVKYSYKLSIKGEKYQLDLSKLLMS